MSEVAITKLINDSLFVVTCLIYLKLIIAFMESLAPPPKQKKRSGTWHQDEKTGEVTSKTKK